MILFVLRHDHNEWRGLCETTIIGIFSTKENAQSALDEASEIDAFKGYCHEFKIQEMTLDKFEFKGELRGP